MANLKRRHSFRKWAPDIGENRDLPEGPALYLEVATGLTSEQLSAVFAALGTTVALVEGDPRGQLRAHYVAGLAPWVRVHGGPHTVDGRTLETLDDYIAIAQTSADWGRAALVELLGALRSFNSFEGPDELFSQRRSGGLASTGSPSAAKDEPTTEGP